MTSFLIYLFFIHILIKATLIKNYMIYILGQSDPILIKLNLKLTRRLLAFFEFKDGSESTK